MTTCELRKKAAQVIQERGWCQGSYGDDASGPVCLVGALCLAEGLSTTSCSRFTASHQALLDMRIRGVKDEWSATIWNDRKTRTKEHVIARLLDGCEGGEDR